MQNFLLAITFLGYGFFLPYGINLFKNLLNFKTRDNKPNHFEIKKVFLTNFASTSFAIQSRIKQMIIDGKKISEEIKAELKERLIGRRLILTVVLVGDDPASTKFVERKKKFGEAIGVEMRVLEFGADILEVDLAEEINKLANNERVSGIVVQLPLPKQINTNKILNLIPAEKDVDALTDNASVDSPVVEAVMEVLRRGHVDLTGKKILVVGQGQLVGRPIAICLAQAGHEVEVVDINTKNLREKTLVADVIISGVGKAGLIKPEMMASPKLSVGGIKEGVVLIDCGTSEQNGQLAGDIDPACADKASLFTPVPGGVGPVVVAKIFENLIKLAKIN